jgi:DNA-binding response OmpR family regulator
VPANERDLYLRIRYLAKRWSVQREPAGMDDDDILRRGGAWAALSPSEAVVVRRLLGARGHLVSRADLRADLDAAAGGPLPFPSSVARLRQRLGSVDLVLHTVRGRGYLVIDAGHRAGH